MPSKRLQVPAAKKACVQRKVGTVMREFHSGELESSSGAKVTSRGQALAIAHSEAGRACGITKKNKKKNKS
jgi:hypothetical protein